MIFFFSMVFYLSFVGPAMSTVSSQWKVSSNVRLPRTEPVAIPKEKKTRFYMECGNKHVPVHAVSMLYDILYTQ